MIISLLGMHIDKRLYFILFHFAVEPHQSAVIAVGTDDDELSDYVAFGFHHYLYGLAIVTARDKRFVIVHFEFLHIGGKPTFYICATLLQVERPDALYLSDQPAFFAGLGFVSHRSPCHLHQ